MNRQVVTISRWGGMVVALVLTTGASSAANFHFSVLGNDQTGDGTVANPWRTIDQFNTLDLDPGDRALFRAGDTFDGLLYLDPSDSGTDALGNLVAPVVIGTYGGATRAVIRSPADQEAFLAYNNGGIEVRDLEFVNGGTHATNGRSGIIFYTDRDDGGGQTRLNHIQLDNVAAHGFGYSGLYVQATAGVGYRDFRVTNSEFHHNQFAGVNILADRYTELIHEEVLIDGVVTHNNPGFVGCEPHCGHGVVIGQVDDAVIQNSVAHTNGAVYGKGNVGLWAWQSNDVVIQHNEAYGNLSPLGPDGGGFDLDGGVTNSVVQYNVSRDNAGAGYLLAEFNTSEPMLQNVFRYNLSVNDGRDGYGGITVWGADGDDLATSTVFHNNTVVLDKDEAPFARGTVWFVNGNHGEIDFINNVFVAENDAALISGHTDVSRADFVNNAYWTDGGLVVVEGVVYPSVAAWAAAEGQEMLTGGFAGIEGDPLFIDDVTFRPGEGSPLLNAALAAGTPPWPVWLSGPGPTDLYGVAFPQGAGLEVGAVEAADPLAGDYNNSGQVEQGDLDLVLQNWGVDTGTAGVPTGWVNDLPSGQIEQTELDGVLQNWGDTASPDFANTDVPEPVLGVLLLLGASALRRRPVSFGGGGNTGRVRSLGHS